MQKGPGAPQRTRLAEAPGGRTPTTDRAVPRAAGQADSSRIRGATREVEHLVDRAVPGSGRAAGDRPGEKARYWPSESYQAFHAADTVGRFCRPHSLSGRRVS